MWSCSAASSETAWLTFQIHVIQPLPIVLDNFILKRVVHYTYQSNTKSCKSNIKETNRFIENEYIFFGQFYLKTVPTIS